MIVYSQQLIEARYSLYIRYRSLVSRSGEGGFLPMPLVLTRTNTYRYVRKHVLMVCLLPVGDDAQNVQNALRVTLRSSILYVVLTQVHLHY
jgi:hypothetical protein